MWPRECLCPASSWKASVLVYCGSWQSFTGKKETQLTNAVPFTYWDFLLNDASIKIFKILRVLILYNQVNRWEECTCLHVGLRAENIIKYTVIFSLLLMQQTRFDYLLVTQLHLQILNFNWNIKMSIVWGISNSAYLPEVWDLNVWFLKFYVFPKYLFVFSIMSIPYGTKPIKILL